MELPPRFARMPSGSLALLRFLGENEVAEADSDTLATGADLSTRALYQAIRNLVTRGYLEMDDARIYYLTDKGISAVEELLDIDATPTVPDSLEPRSIFISYSRKDADVASFIANELKSKGMDVFIDYQQLVGGEDFTERIANEISNRDAVVFLLSRDSVNSKWVRAEVNWAFNKDKQIIPVMLENVDMSRFFYLITVQQIDFTIWTPAEDMSDSLARLFRALASQ